MLQLDNLNHGVQTRVCRAIWLAHFAPDSGSEPGDRRKDDNNNDNDRAERLKTAAFAKVATELAKSENLPPILRQQYQDAAEKVIERMPPTALDTWHKNFRGIDFYPSAKSVDLKSQELKKVLGQAIDPGKFTAAFIDPGGRIHLNGGSELGQKAMRTTSQYYAHEFAHIIDLQGNFSQTPDWQLAWSQESAAIRKALTKERGQSQSPEEGFAHFVMLAWLYREMAERHFPKSLKLLIQWGLA